MPQKKVEPIYGLGERLRHLRENNNLTQREVAERIGVNKNTIGKYESDTANPSLQTIIKFALMYNVSIDYLVGIGKESYLYLNEFSENQRKFILDTLNGLKENFDSK